MTLWHLYISIPTGERRLVEFAPGEPEPDVIAIPTPGTRFGEQFARTTVAPLTVAELEGWRAAGVREERGPVGEE